MIVVSKIGKHQQANTATAGDCIGFAPGLPARLRLAVRGIWVPSSDWRAYCGVGHIGHSYCSRYLPHDPKR